MVESGRVPGKGRICASIEKLSRQVPKKVESGQVPGKGRIRASIEKLPRQLPKKGRISMSTAKWQNPGQYREKVHSVRVS